LPAGTTPAPAAAARNTKSAAVSKHAWALLNEECEKLIGQRPAGFFALQGIFAVIISRGHYAQRIQFCRC
jgi:hypothetical protein